MPDPMNFQELMAQITKARQMMAETHQSAPPGPDKDALGQILESLEKSQADAEEKFGKAVSAVQDDLAQTESKLDELKRQYAEANSKAQAAIAKASEAPPPVPEAPAPTAVPGLGEQLRDELLGLMSGEGDSPAADAKRGEIWQDWDSSKE